MTSSRTPDNDTSDERLWELDALIDAMNAGKRLQPDEDGLAALADTVRDLQMLRVAQVAPDEVAPPPSDHDFPSSLAANLEHALRRNQMKANGTVDRTLTQQEATTWTIPSSNGVATPLEHSPFQIAEPVRPGLPRQLLGLAAAIAAFIIVGALLSIVLRGPGSGGEQPGELGAGSPQGGSGMSESTTSPTFGIETPGTGPDRSTVQSYEEAQQLVSFILVVPSTVPGDVSVASVDVDSLSDGTAAVTANYAAPNDGAPITYRQSTAGCLPMDDSGATGSATVTIDGVDVTQRTLHLANGDEQLHYTWQDGRLCFDVSGQVRPSFGAAVYEEMVAAVIQSVTQLPTDDLYPSTPTVEASNSPTVASSESPVAVVDPTSPSTSPSILPGYPLVTLSRDYGTCDDGPITVSGSAFEAGSTVTVLGGQFPGDNFAALVEGVAVDAAGFFSVDIELDRLFSECSGGDATVEGSMVTIFVSTVNGDGKTGEYRDPNDGTVFVFSREVPTGVVERTRTLSCGTEVQRNQTVLAPELGPDPAKRRCFVQAGQSGQPAEFIVHRQTNEGDFVTEIYRVLNNGSIEYLLDATRDRFGSGKWESVTCTGIGLDPQTLEFTWESCNEGVPLDEVTNKPGR